MDASHRLLHLASQQQIERLHAQPDGLFDRFTFTRWRLAKYIVDNFGAYARMADAKPQAPEVGAAELGLDILQTVVPGMAAALLELDLPRQQVKLIMDNEYFVGRRS